MTPLYEKKLCLPHHTWGPSSSVQGENLVLLSHLDSYLRSNSYSSALYLFLSFSDLLVVFRVGSDLKVKNGLICQCNKPFKENTNQL